MSVEAITFRCAEDAKPRLRDAANQLPPNQRPAAYSVEDSIDMVTDERYVSLDFDAEASVSVAQEVARLIHERAGKPRAEAILWAPGNGIQRLAIVELASSAQDAA